jgi:transglutaminase-like putative cysteine protease
MHRSWRYPACLVLLLFVVKAATADLALDEPFMPRGATVLLFPSLAGDLESERTYAGQLKSLVQLADQSSAERLLLFWEGAEDMASRSRLKAQRYKPSRAEFLNAIAQLPASTNPVVAFIWGHGGMQGQAPVFHVRGPRLTPGDFKQFADKATTGPSTWVLMFRGSGHFATDLSSPQRHIIASEGESVFRNEPVGMSVLVKLLRTKPNSTLRGVADAFGPAVAKWFDDQNLARTEEPTLWAATESPRALIAATPVLEKETASETPPKPAVQTGEPSARTNAPAWGDIARVKPSDYPDADSVILQRRITYTLGASPAVAAEHEEFIQILTAEGKDAGDFDIPYSPPHEKLEFLACEVQRPDGSVLKVDPDEIRETDESSEAPGSALTQRKFFSVPDVHPGAIIHIRYTREWQKFPLPHVTLEMPLADDSPVRDTLIRISVPKDSPFHFRSEHTVTPDPKLSQTDYSSTYTWQLRETLAWRPDPLTLPDNQPSLSISTFPDWKTFADWYERIIRLSDQSTPEITNKAAEITRDLTLDRERVAALYNYVTGLRYVAVPLGVNSFRPHAASGVLRNQYGDCKDKANLFNALLRSQGIDAHLVLVPRFGQAYESLPGFAFNHAISRVSLGGESLWLDTTDDVCRFGTLPPGDPGRRVLVIDGSDKLAQLPRPLAKDNAFNIAIELDASDPGAAQATIRAQATGYADYALRAAARRMHKRSPVPLLSSALRLANGSFALQSQQFTSPSDLENNFQVEMTGTAIGICALDTTNGFVRSPLLIPAEWTIALHSRRQPLFLNDGYPLLVSEGAEIKLPRNVRAELPPDTKNEQGPLRWSVSWSRSSDKALMVALDCELAKSDLSMAETTQFQRQVRELFTVLSRPAIVSVSNPNNP